MVFHWSLSNSNSPQVSRTLLSIRADPNNAVVWMVSNRLLISKSSNHCTNTFVIVPSMPITVGYNYYYLLIVTWFGLLTGILWSVYISKSQRILSYLPNLSAQAGYYIISCHILDTRWSRILSLCRDAVCVFYNPAQAKGLVNMIIIKE